MDIKQLNYFMKVYEDGSFAKAATNNFISPQGINMAIIKLEKELGQKLFIRNRDGITITPKGEFLYKKATAIMHTINECESYFQKELIGKPLIHISYVPELFSALPYAAYSLISNDSTYSLALKAGGALACEEDLINGNSTFALVNGPQSNPRLNYEYCFSKNRLLIANRNHPLAERKELTMKDLKNCKFIMVNSSFKTYHDFIGICQGNGFIPNIVFTTDALSTTYKLVRNNTDLIGLSFDFYVEQNNDSNITLLPISDLTWPWDIFLAYRKDVTLSDTECNFKKTLLANFYNA